MDQTGLPSRHDLALRLSPPRCRVSSPPLSPHSGSPTGWQDQQDPAAGSFRVEMSQTQSWFPFKSKPLTLYDYPYTLSVLLEMIHALVIKEVSGVWCDERKVTAFWSVSDFSYPNHVHATDVARLFLFLSWSRPLCHVLSPPCLFVHENVLPAATSVTRDVRHRATQQNQW